MAILDKGIIKIDDYVVLTDEREGLQINSVGIVRSINLENIYEVFFIGRQKDIWVPRSAISLIDLAKTGKPHKHKICNVCHILKDYYGDFEINQTDARGRKTTRPSCRDCRKNIDGTCLLPQERRKLINTRPKGFFICPICEKGSIPSVTANLVMDHDHDTGKAREWLCDSCNTGLGRFKDDKQLLLKALEYLNKHSDKAN